MTSTTCSSSSASRTSRTTRSHDNIVYIVDSKGPDCGTAHCEPGYAVPIDERPRLEDGARPERPHGRDLSNRARRGDDNPVKTLNEIHQPDNIESTPTGLLLVTEDPGSSQQFAPTDTSDNATTGRLWFVPFTGSPQVVVKIDQSADGNVTDVGPLPTLDASIGNQGAWETTGIVDASAASVPVLFSSTSRHIPLGRESAGSRQLRAVGADFTFKREGGQLLLLRLPS